MALIACPDCSNQISDAAVTCPHCGKPMRLGREAILIEIQVAESDWQRQRDIIDMIMDLEGDAYERNKESLDEAEAMSAKIGKRLAELRAMLA